MISEQFYVHCFLLGSMLILSSMGIIPPKVAGAFLIGWGSGIIIGGLGK